MTYVGNGNIGIKERNVRGIYKGTFVEKHVENFTTNVPAVVRFDTNALQLACGIELCFASCKILIATKQTFGVSMLYNNTENFKFKGSKSVQEVGLENFKKVVWIVFGDIIRQYEQIKFRNDYTLNQYKAELDKQFMKLELS